MHFSTIAATFLTAFVASATAIPSPRTDNIDSTLQSRSNPNDDVASIHIFSDEACTKDSRPYKVTGDQSHECINVSNMRGLKVASIIDCEIRTWSGKDCQGTHNSVSHSTSPDACLSWLAASVELAC